MPFYRQRFGELGEESVRSDKALKSTETGLSPPDTRALRRLHLTNPFITTVFTVGLAVESMGSMDGRICRQVLSRLLTV